MRLTPYLSICGLMFCLNNAYGASFDCTKAKSAIEKTICQNNELNKLDEELAKIYKDALQTFPVEGFVRSQQRDWLSLIRLTDCKQDCSQKLVTEYRKRMSELRELSEAQVFSSAPKFKMEDGDAIALILPRKDGVSLKIWGGFRIHAQASKDAGKPVYTGCEFRGSMQSVNARSAKDGGVVLNFKIDGKIMSIDDPSAGCEGFGTLPDKFARVK